MFQSGLPLKASRFRGPFRRESSFSAEPRAALERTERASGAGALHTCSKNGMSIQKKPFLSAYRKRERPGQRRTLSGFSAFMDLLFHRPPFLPIHTIQKKRGQGFGKPKSLWRGGEAFLQKSPPAPPVQSIVHNPLRLPAVVHPEPLIGRAADHALIGLRIKCGDRERFFLSITFKEGRVQRLLYNNTIPIPVADQRDGPRPRPWPGRQGQRALC